jgi:hypothetical protein
MKISRLRVGERVWKVLLVFPRDAPLSFPLSNPCPEASLLITKVIFGSEPGQRVRVLLTAHGDLACVSAMPRRKRSNS